MTRAKDELNLIVPQRFYTHGQARMGDRHLYAARSRFIPASVAGYFTRMHWPNAEEKRAAAPSIALCSVIDNPLPTRPSGLAILRASIKALIWAVSSGCWPFRTVALDRTRPRRSVWASGEEAGRPDCERLLMG
jgi:hypothetical protein